MTFYIQVSNGYITDCIEYAFGDYIDVDFPVPLPDRFISGIYKYLGNNNFQLDEAKLSALEEKEKTSTIDSDLLAFITGLKDGYTNDQ